jgi:magnesium chelatase family protein
VIRFWISFRGFHEKGGQIKGALPIVIEARRLRKKAVILPKLNASEAAVVEGIEVYGGSNLR